MNKKIIILNGPPGSGKDAAAEAIVRHLGAEHLKLAGPLKTIAAAMLNISPDQIEGIKSNLVTDIFGKPFGDLRSNATVRDFLIYLSEKCLKPMFGEDIFGIIATAAIKTSIHSRIVFSDCGFYDELREIILEVGRPNVLLIKIEREGYSFTNDSRDYLLGDQFGIKEITLFNSGTIEEFKENVVSEAKTWLD